MTKKKLTALMTAIVCLTASFSGFSVFAEDAAEALPVREMVVIGVDNEEDPKNFFLVCPEMRATYYLSESLVAQRLPEGTIEYGDILEFHGEWFSTLLSATNPYQALESSSIEGTYIEITGSVLDQQVPVVYEVERPVSYSVIQLSNGETAYNLCLDYLLHKGYQQETAVDWAALRVGDEITMLTYNNFPCIPVEIDPLGDVNSDSILNVLDVVTMNKHLLTGADLPALASASGEAKLAKSGETDLGQCDFNGNGVIDPDDSLCMLKRIVGLETIEVE